MKTRVVWCNASSIATGVVVETGGLIAEKAAWTDSATVLSWVNSTVEESGRICTKGVGEIIVRQRLKILKEVIFKFGLWLKAVLVPSEKNKADTLTQVNKNKWLDIKKEDEVPVCCLGTRELEELYVPHGSEKNFIFSVKSCLSCRKGRSPEYGQELHQMSVDLSPSIHDLGEIEITNKWRRLAIDITHYCILVNDWL